MEFITYYVKKLILLCGVTGQSVPYVTHIVLAVVAVLLAMVAGYVCRRVITPLILKVTARTEASWDDVLLNERVLLSASRIIPAIVIWGVLPMTFYEFPTLREILSRLLAIYITVMATRTLIVFIDSLKLLEEGQRTARQQYLYSFCGVLKIIVFFLAAIVVVAIVVNKDPSTLFAGLGAASAILMLAFQDTIKGLVAGIRLTSNDMMKLGDRITVPSAGADGIVEEITLTTVKVRNFDNTIITVTPQTLVDGSFQNWKGMVENPGRKAVRKVYIDFRSMTLGDDGVPNLTRYREHMEQWLAKHEKVQADNVILVHQLDATPTGLPVEFVFWVKFQDAVNFEHAISEIMEYAYAAAAEYGLRIYQQFPEQ